MLAAGAVLASYFYLRRPEFGDRVYRIGWGTSPPCQVRGADGGPAGISVDLVNHAAQRLGIQLRWIYWNDTSESALTSNSVDLWPLITITPERLKVLHISDPYLQHEHCLLVRDDAPYREMGDLATAKIGMANVNIDARNLRKVLPAALPAPRTTIGAVMADVCKRVSDAAFMDRFTAMTALLHPVDCGGHSLRWIPVPQLYTQLGVGSTFEAKPVADALRAEIGVLSEEGRLSEVFGQWGFVSGQDLTSVKNVIEARRRAGLLLIVALVFALMFLVACGQTVRLMREKTRTQQAERALRESQENYMQAQKMESIGRLAGGVAHDFNNLLTVINGYSEIVFHQLPESDSMRQQVNEIRRAGEHAAELTQQLLTFSRKQVGRPRPLKLNSVVKEAEKMLRRLLGEDVQLTTRLDPSLGLIMADPGYMHQMLMNLTVNARDAMPAGGTLSIETANVALEACPAEAQSEIKRGPSVCLSVSDTGSGMDEATRKNIFEPFFTTKGTKGTGLGLATVYGIVQQTRGWIEVISEPGKGATFRVYFPQVEGVDEPITAQPAVVLQSANAETVLVVEDQDDVRTFVVEVLSRRGYEVLQAADGNQALAIAEGHSGKIHVLLTDVVLPGMNGRQLADRFRSVRPDTKVIYTSGYTQDLIADRGVLHRDVNYVPKPYTADQITAKVRAAIEKS